MQGGFGAGDAFGVNAGLQVGDPLGGSNLLMPIVVGLGVLTFINIIADMFAWFGRNEPNKPNNDDGDDDDDARRGRSVKTLYLICCYNIYNIYNVLLKLHNYIYYRSGREITDMAFSVLDAIQNLQDKYATQE